MKNKKPSYLEGFLPYRVWYFSIAFETFFSEIDATDNADQGTERVETSNSGPHPPMQCSLPAVSGDGVETKVGRGSKAGEPGEVWSDQRIR